ncbi:uncharacterized protein LOC135121882 [Zophobas morio]|uniref:uncharacterized protein LOC135121882 n=1 Tax=Zophobas morio TaxID=2755281 RepID=UPI003083CC20
MESKLSEVNCQELLTEARDKIKISNLSCRGIVGLDRWERKIVQPLIFNITLYCNTKPSGTTDCLNPSHNYSHCAGLIIKYSESQEFESLFSLTHNVAHLIILTLGILKVKVECKKPAALLCADSAGVKITRTCLNFPEGYAHFLKFDRKKIINISLANSYYHLNAADFVPTPGCSDQIIIENIHGRHTTAFVLKKMDENSYKTIEALAEFIAKSCLKELNILRIIINLKKLKALVFAQYSAVQITRNLSDYEN